MKRNNCKGFSIVETLCMLAIIMILAGLLMSTIAITRGKAKESKCINNQYMLAKALILYATDYEIFPTTLGALDQKYFPNAIETEGSLFESTAYAAAPLFTADYYQNMAEVKRCPEVRADSNGSYPTSYGMNLYVTNIPYGTVTNPSITVLTADSSVLYMESSSQGTKRHMGGIVASYADGHVEWLRELTPFTFTTTTGESETEESTGTGGSTGGSTGGDTGGSTGGDTGGSTGGDTGGSTGGDTGGSTGGDTGGSTGGDTGGSTGGDTGGSTGGDTGGTTGGDTGGTTDDGTGNNGHGNNYDGVDISNPGEGSGGPNGEVDTSAPVDDEMNTGNSGGDTSTSTGGDTGGSTEAPVEEPLFDIEGGTVTVHEEATAHVQILAAQYAIDQQNWYDVYVDVLITIPGGEQVVYNMMGPDGSGFNGSMLPEELAGSAWDSDPFDAESTIDIVGTSKYWVKEKQKVNGKWKYVWTQKTKSTYSTQEDLGIQVWVLKDGDVVPSKPGLWNQISVGDAVEQYTETLSDGTKVMNLQENQVIYFFELGQTSPYLSNGQSNPGYDMNDLVVLVDINEVEPVV